MKTVHKIFTLIVIVTFLHACKDNKTEEILLPSNLQVTTEVSTTTPGLVSVTATAQNANFFTLYYGDIANETPIQSADGKGTHTYTSSGTFTIRVEAHTTASAFVTSSKDVTIQLKGTGIPTTGYTTPTSYAGMSLVWNDEFEGTQVNIGNWTFETGGGGWGNHELEYYKPENTIVKDGYLVITAKKESFSGSNYTSSRMITKDKHSFIYGRADIRAILPKGQGIWPALWMLGSDIDTTPWPACGEIDIMEMIGGGIGRDNKIYGTAHWDQAGHVYYGKNYTLPSGIFADEFHVYSIVWNANSITWYVDDIQYTVIDTTPAGLSEFQKQFFFIFNVAVGGDWPGNPDASTSFPQSMIVDYIRVFQ